MKRFTSVRSVCFVAISLIAAGAVGQDTPKESVSALVTALGYGGAIHNFKNCVLRGDARSQAAAQKSFDQAKHVLAVLGKAQGLTAQQRAAVAEIASVVRAYEAQLPAVTKMHGQGKSVEEIDEAVTVDDSAAIEAMDTLRKEHTWSSVEELDFHMGYGSGIHNFKNFVLRADEQYRAKATLGLSNVSLIIARYRASGGLSTSQIEALGEMESVVRKYEEALAKVQELIGEGRTAQQIDAVVRVDDAPALAALATLRK